MLRLSSRHIEETMSSAPSHLLIALPAAVKRAPGHTRYDSCFTLLLNPLVTPEGPAHVLFLHYVSSSSASTHEALGINFTCLSRLRTCLALVSTQSRPRRVAHHIER